MDPDEFEEFVGAALAQQSQPPQQKVIVQRNSPILFPGGGPLTLNATSSLLVPNSSVQPPPQLSFGTAAGPSLVDATSVIVLNKDSLSTPMAIPINVVTAEQTSHQPPSQFMQKVVMAAGTGAGSVQLMPAGTMKSLQQKVSHCAIDALHSAIGVKTEERDCFSRYVTASAAVALTIFSASQHF